MALSRQPITEQFQSITFEFHLRDLVTEIKRRSKQRYQVLASMLILLKLNEESKSHILTIMCFSLQVNAQNRVTSAE